MKKAYSTKPDYSLSTQLFLIFAVCAFVASSFFFNEFNTKTSKEIASKPSFKDQALSRIQNLETNLNTGPHTVIAAPGSLNVGIGNGGGNCTNGQMIMIGSNGQAYCGDISSAFSGKTSSFAAMGVGVTSPTEVLHIKHTSAAFNPGGMVLEANNGASAYNLINSNGALYLGYNTTSTYPQANYSTVFNIPSGGALNSINGFQWNGQSLDARYPGVTGANASGTWGINVTGNAGTVTNGVYTNSASRWPLGVWMYAPGNSSSNRNFHISATDMYWETAGSFHWRNAADAEFASLTSAGALSVQSVSTSTLTTGSNITMNGNVLVTNGSDATYGALTIQGAKNGWSGIKFRNAAGTAWKTLMIEANSSGVYNNADNGWDWYFTNGTLTTGIIPGANVSGNISGSAANITQYTINQSLGTGNSPTFYFPQVAAIRIASGSGTNTLEDGGAYINQHATGTGSGGFHMYDSGSNSKGYAGYWDSTGFGMLTSAGAWQWRANLGSPNTEFYGQLYIDNYASVPCNCWTAWSDARLKKNVNNLGTTLDKIVALRPITFEYKDEAYGKMPGEQLKGLQKGFIAQEMEKIFPEWVATDKDNGYKQVNMQGFESVIVEAIKELNNKTITAIKEIKAEIAAITTHNNSQDQEISDLKAQVEILKQQVQTLKAK